MKKISLPTMSRAIPIAPESLDDKARTVKLSFGTGARVLRSDFWTGDQYIEELSMDPAHVRMARFQSGSSPLCKDHNSYSLDGMLGVIRAASIENGELICDAQFSAREDVEPYYQDVKAGIIRNASVGYRIYKMQDVTQPEDKVKVLRAIDWEPLEGSLVPVGADAGAGVRSQNQTAYPCEIIETRAESAQGESMPQIENEPAAAAAEPKVQNPATSEPALSASRAEDGSKSALEIMKAVRKAGLDAQFAEELIEGGKSLDQARAAIIDKIAVRTEETKVRPHVAGGAPANEAKRMEAATDALLHRADPSKYAFKPEAREFRGMTLLEVAKSFLASRGVSTMGMTKMEVASRALEGTSDFPALLQNVAGKRLRDGYQAAPQTFRPWCREGMAPDFKQLSRVQLSDFPSLELVDASGEIKRGAMTDGKEVYQLATYAKIVGINRQAIINDDTDAFSRIPSLMGRAAADLESDSVYAILLANAAMADAIALFHASHGNLAAAGTVLDVTNVSKMRKAFRQQKNLQKRPIALLPKFLIVSSNDETAAEQVINPIVPNAAASVNPFSGKYQVLVEPRLDVAAGAQPWYGAADPGQIDTIEFSYLEGQQGVYMENRIGFDVDGVEMKVRLDFAAKALDWRGIYKNPGT
jgi:hypothetical protein